MEHKITMPLSKEKLALLKTGDNVYLTGTIYTARDAAHEKIVELINNGEELPFPIKNSVIYYVGPSPAKPGQVIGSAGPTTSYRMDAYTPTLLSLGQSAMIGKGQRCATVICAIKQHKAVYFGAIGGAGALLAGSVKKSEVIAFEELGAEAIYKLDVVNFPLVVIIDSNGQNLYETGRKAYLSQ